MSEIFTENPGQATDDPPELYARWYRCDAAVATNGEIAAGWRMTFPADREFWTGLAAAQAAAAALRDGVTAVAARLVGGAAATSPSRKSELESGIAAELRKLLEG